MNTERKIFEIADSRDFYPASIVQEFLEVYGIAGTESSILLGDLEKLQEDLSEAIKEIKRYRESY